MPSKTTKLFLGSTLIADLTTFALATDLSTHTGNAAAHVTAAEKNEWNAKLDGSALTAHTGNADIHITAVERTSWNAKLDSTALTAHANNTVIHITAAERTSWNAKMDSTSLASYATQSWTTTQLGSYAQKSEVATAKTESIAAAKKYADETFTRAIALTDAQFQALAEKHPATFYIIQTND